MNLGLVVVVAVALTVPNLSVGRTVHKCELKEQLEEALVLPKKLQRQKERILAIVVCEVIRMSHLDTGLVKVFDKRRSTTIKPPTGSTTPVEPTGPTTPVEPTGPTTPVEPTGPTNPAMTTSETNRTAVIARAKRAADSNSSEADLSDSLEEVMTEEERKVREGLENSMMGNDETKEEEGQEEDEDEEDTEEEEGQEENDDEEEGGEHKKRGLKKIVHRSIGFYGLFQLSDSYFCNSGYHWSKNKCNTSCTAFTDDNIEDDIECLVKSHYWWTLVMRASRRCRSYHSYNYLRSCN